RSGQRLACVSFGNSPSGLVTHLLSLPTAAPTRLSNDGAKKSLPLMMSERDASSGPRAGTPPSQTRPATDRALHQHGTTDESMHWARLVNFAVLMRKPGPWRGVVTF